jgi:hypothetical protein
MSHWQEKIINIVSIMVSMAEKLLIMLRKLKYSQWFLGSQLQIKVY